MPGPVLAAVYPAKAACTRTGEMQFDPVLHLMITGRITRMPGQVRDIISRPARVGSSCKHQAQFSIMQHAAGSWQTLSSSFLKQCSGPNPGRQASTCRQSGGTGRPCWPQTWSSCPRSWCGPWWWLCGQCARPWCSVLQLESLATQHSPEPQAVASVRGCLSSQLRALCSHISQAGRTAAHGLLVNVIEDS